MLDPICFSAACWCKSFENTNRARFWVCKNFLPTLELFATTHNWSYHLEWNTNLYSQFVPGVFLQLVWMANNFARCPVTNDRDFKIGDYGLPTVGREAFGTGMRQRALPWATFVALGRYVVEQIHVVENRLQRRQRVRLKGKKKRSYLSNSGFMIFLLKEILI